MRILVSACLLGAACRYDGKSREIPEVCALKERHTLVPFCPEVYGGLPTPRPAAERRGERVVNRLGQDVTAQFLRGAGEALRLYRALGCQGAVLKERSPSCGAGEIYDGSFSSRLISGDGMTAELFRREGIPIWGESGIPALLEGPDAAQMRRSGPIRPAFPGDASRVAEIIVFNNRMNYLPIFRDEGFSFGKVQVVRTVEEYLGGGAEMEGIFVYDDGVVRGFVQTEGSEVRKLYVDTFFQGRGIGGELLRFAVEKLGARWLWVLEKNDRAQRFYARHGFVPTGERKLEEGTEEYVVKLRHP